MKRENQFTLRQFEIVSPSFTTLADEKETFPPPQNNYKRRRGGGDGGKKKKKKKKNLDQVISP